jgi:hypothetical protein
MEGTMRNTEYTGSCLIGVVGSDLEYVESRDSIMALEYFKGDQMRFIRATKGYEARQMILDEFMASEHAFCLFLDQDQTFPVDTLTRLRAHKLPYVSGYYLRRRFNPILPVWLEYSEKNELPYLPWTREPERGKLHKLGASGWGCILVHRDVVTAVRSVLKGEKEILEDDMDVWPYDLRKVLKGEEQIRPLRADKSETIGSDIRFPFFAREAGFTLYGDPDVRCGHMAHYEIHPDDYSTASPEMLAQLGAMAADDRQKHQRIVKNALEALK